MLTVDRNSPIPLYFQLKQILLGQIDQKDWGIGDMIPSEQELQDHYGLSRTTVRQTLSELVSEGRLVRHRGRGTFVAEPKIAHNPSAGMALSEYIIKQGLQPSWRVIDRQWCVPATNIQTALEVSENSKVYRVEMLFSAEKVTNQPEPIGMHIAYLPTSSLAGVEMSMKNADWIEFLRNIQNRPNHNIQRTFEAYAANALESNHLAVAENSPVLGIQIKTTDAENVPVVVIEARFRGDRFKFQITV